MDKRIATSQLSLQIICSMHS